ncbi:MAG: aminoacyl-tRNA hydrolase [Phycisphaeraceae bacterium]
MKLVVGLGNPGVEYAGTRHNVGFMVVELLAQRHGLVGPAKGKFHAAVLEGQVASERCLLMQPVTYMNRSGLAVGEAVRFYKLEPADVLVIVDDVALPCGRIRLRAGGSAGGHNGLADVARVLATDEYPRLRVGIDPPGRAPQRDYVLGKFSREQMELMTGAIERAADAAEMWMREGIEKAMTAFNGN